MDYETPDLFGEIGHRATYHQQAGFSCTDDRIQPEINHSHHRKLDQEEKCDTDISGKRHVETGAAKDNPYVLPSSNCRMMHFETVNEERPAENALRRYIKSEVPAQLVTNEYGEQCSLSEVLPTKLAGLQAKLWREVPRVAASRLTFDASADCTRHDIISADTVVQIAECLANDHVFVLSTVQSQSCSFELCSLFHDTFQLPHGADQITLEPTFHLTTLTPARDYNKLKARILVFQRDRYKFMEYGQPLKNYFPKPSKTFCPECLVYLWNKRVHVWEIMDSCAFQGDIEVQQRGPAQTEAVTESHGDSEAWIADIIAYPSDILDAELNDECDDGGVSVASLTISEHARLLDRLESITQDTDTFEAEDLSQTEWVGHDTSNLLELGMETSEETTDDFDTVSPVPSEVFLRDTGEGNETRLQFPQLDGAGDTHDHAGPLSRSSESDCMRGSEARSAKLAIRVSRPELPRSTAARISAQKEIDTATTAAQSTMMSFWATSQPKPLSWKPKPMAPLQNLTQADHAEDEVTWLEFLQAQAKSPKLGTVQSGFDKKKHHDFYKGLRINAPVQPPNPMEIHGLVFPIPPTVDLGPVYLNRLRTKPLEDKEGHIKREDILGKATNAGAGGKNQSRATEQQTIDYWFASGGPVPVGTKNASAPSTLRDLSVNVRKPLSRGAAKPSASPVKGQKAGSPLKQLFSLFTPRSSPVKPMLKDSPPGASSYMVKEDEQASPTTKPEPNLTPNPTLKSPEFLKKFQTPIFCYCRKPDDGKKMVQCSNPDCNYGWFHHTCLSKPEKLSCTSKTRQWTCQVCKLYKVAQTAPSSLDSHFPFLKEEILDALAVPGPNGNVSRNPYGFGLHDPYKVGLPEQEPVSESEAGESFEDYEDDEQYEEEDDEQYEEEDDEMGGTGDGVTDEEGRDSGYYSGDKVMKDAS